MTESLADRIELLSSINLTERYELADEVRALEILVKMRPMKDVEQEEEIKKLKARIADWKKETN